MYQTKGIIIKKEDRGEHDKLITFFTKEYGKIDILSKSVRKGSSKLAAHLDLLNFTDVFFVLGKRYKVLTSAVEINSFLGLKKDLRKVKVAARICFLVGRFHVFDERDDDVFEMLKKAFEYLENKELNDIELEYFLRYFEYRFLVVLGYAPQDDLVVSFFSPSKRTISKKEMEKVELVLLRYFNNIL